jgi:lipid II:glycine glycyltransferase (peptidoglycan interpeptide bridge formation enzyme)
MRHETRKLIRRAARDGVEIAEGTDQDIDDFYRMLRSTSEIKDFPIHDKVFYEQAWKTFQSAGSSKLLLAKYQGEIVAGKMMVFL